MGASAFVMAEVLGVPYIKICVAAMIPAILYYWSTWVMVDFRAAKTGLKGQPRSVLPSARKLMKKSGFMLIPLLILLFALAVLNVSAMKAALMAIYSAVIVSFIDKIRKRLPIFEAFKAVGHETLRGLERGVKDSLLIVSACATAGILIGCIDITGMGLKLSGTLIDLAGGNLLLLLILTMIASIILGMGLPTLACYIILAVLVAPTLTKIGLLPIAAHLFVFYFGILSAITPPVAGAVYAAAGLAGTGIISTGISTVRLGLLAFILPYFFVYWPALLFQGPILDIFLAFISACVGVYFFGSAIEGYLFKPLNFLWRVYFFIGAFLCIAPGLLTDLIGYGMLGSGLAWHLYQRKKVRVFTGRKEETEVLFSINPK
jgi:TRAP transporter 4TM/12TM fusion protein